MQYEEQRAEIEKLKADNEYLNGQYLIADMAIEKATNEAVKEFAEKIKIYKYQSSDWSHGEHPYVVEEADIDDVLIEMVGDVDG